VVTTEGFEIVCEIEPATQPSFDGVRRQVGILATTASSLLIPDNHLGRATVSSVAVAHEVAALGAHPIACLNSRDRNRLGFARDLLTAAAYGVESLLFVYGDRPASGSRAHDLNVGIMLEEARAFAAHRHPDHPGFRLGVTTRLAPIPEWKRDADMLFVQAGFDLDALFAWRSTVHFDGPVYAGVLVVASVAMAQRVMDATAEIAVPSGLLAALAEDRSAGVTYAVEQVARIASSGLVDGVHLIPVGRYRAVASLLEARGIVGAPPSPLAVAVRPTAGATDGR
jgi:5,10-methylenetetrahydrofolate reductase